MERLINANEYPLNPGFNRSIAGNEKAVQPRQTKEHGKKSFLVYTHNKYLTIATETIAFFYISYDVAIIVQFDRHEYSVNYSLEQIQQLLSESQFFRLNRQYLVNFQAIFEVEHYFARKLLVKLVIPTREKLLVSKQKATKFLRWLENR